MKECFMKYTFVSLMNYFSLKEEDTEESLKRLGSEMGKRMIILRDFHGEESLEELLYRIVYILLPYFYHSERKLVLNSSEEGTYLITENNPLMNRSISLPESYKSFSCDTLIAGAIESFLIASGFDVDVTAHNVESIENPDKIVYVVKLKGRII